MPVRVYIDSCILILAASSREDEIAERAMKELDRDGEVTYLHSTLVEMEVIPQTVINGKNEEREFYDTFFLNSEKVICGDNELKSALNLMCSNAGLASMDALHVAAAIASGADELITSERLMKPLPKAETAGRLSIKSISDN